MHAPHEPCQNRDCYSKALQSSTGPHRIRSRDSPTARKIPTNSESGFSSIITVMNTRESMYHVAPELAGETLTAALRQWTGASWGEVRKLVRTRRVTVNGNLCLDEARRLKETDVVKVLAQSAAPPPKPENIRIVYVDEHVVVVDKPPGITSTRHREELSWPARRRQRQPTLDELLPQILDRKEARRGKKTHRGVPPPVRPVHRLDRDTSGLMVFARTVKAERGLMEQFKQHTTQRRYLAVAEGDVKAQTIDLRLVRDRGDGRRGTTTKPDVGKHAVTHVKPIERLDGYTLIECRLETGRTHQIRIHLAEKGRPLCGEKVYRKPLFGKLIPDRSGAPRIALHAATLGFQHPVTGKKLFFESPLPADIVRLLDRLRSRNSGAHDRR
jgi:23S rRNA pseudouridine1911/1915/1917 synthase